MSLDSNDTVSLNLKIGNHNITTVFLASSIFSLVLAVLCFEKLVRDFADPISRLIPGTYKSLKSATATAKDLKYGSGISKSVLKIFVPQIPILKIILQTLIWGEGRASYFQKVIQKYGNIVEARVGSNRFIFINDYKLGKELFKNPVFNGRARSEAATFVAQGQFGILSSSGAQWKEQRKFVHSHLKEFGFGTKNMEAFIQNEISELLESWAQLNGQRFTPNKHFYLPVLNSVWANLSGKRASVEDGELIRLLSKVYKGFQQQFEIQNVFLTRAELKYSVFKKIINFIPIFWGMMEFHKYVLELRSYFQNVIQARIQNLNRGDTRNCTDFIDVYLLKVLETKDPESNFFGKKGEMNLLAVMMEFFIAGGDTTANMLTWAVLHLIRNPPMQNKIHEEISQTIGTSRCPSLADRPRCPYTEAFLLEVLRMNPVASVGFPHETTQDTNIGAYYVYKGTSLIFNVYGIHHDPIVWGDPQNFRPERFLSQDGKTLVKDDAMCIFSFGPRRCIGEQSARDHLFLFVSSIVQRFELKQDPSISTLPPIRDTKSAVHTSDVFYMVAIDRFLNSNKT